MKPVLSSRKHHCVARASVFLITVALIAGVIGCTQSVLSYQLTIAGTAGGSVTVPGEGTSSYEEGTVVDLVATADPDYEFVNWTGDVNTIDDVDDATTSIVMNGDYSITANFAKQQYDLTVTSSAGGSVTMPGEGTFVHEAGAVVNLVAEAEAGYKFVGWTGDVGAMKDFNAAETTITIQGSYLIAANFDTIYGAMVAGGGLHTVGLKADGTVIAVGYNEYGECVVASWTDVIQIAAGTYHTMGVRADGTVLSAGWLNYGRSDVGGWTNIIQVATGCGHTVGLRADGTVVAVGDNEYGQCNVSVWRDIVQVATGCHHTVGLKADGTVVAVGNDGNGQCDVGSWMDIVQVAGGYQYTLGLKADGTVVAVGEDAVGECDVGGWRDIVQVAAGCGHSLGLRSDGTVVAVGNNGSGQCDVGGWSDMVRVAAGCNHSVGLRSDGTVVAVGENGWLQCDVAGWDLD